MGIKPIGTPAEPAQPILGPKLSPAQAKRVLGTLRLAVDKKHLRVLPGHRVLVEMDGRTYKGHVTKTVGDGRVQFQITAPISKSAKTLEQVTAESRRTREDFMQFHDRLNTGNASVYLLPEPASKQRKGRK